MEKNSMINSEENQIIMKYHIIHYMKRNDAEENITKKLERASISLSSGVMKYKDCNFNYDLRSHDSKTGCLLELAIETTDDYLTEIEEIDERVKGIKHNHKERSIDVIRQWDGLSYYYAYEVINDLLEIEIWFRDIITLYFHKSTGETLKPSMLPRYSDSIEKRVKRKDGIENELDKSDMGFLKDAFVTPFSLKSISTDQFQNDLESCKRGEINFDTFYERYNCETLAERISPFRHNEIENFFGEYWDDVYDTRCAVAHHRYLRSDKVERVREAHKAASDIYELCKKEILNIKLSDGMMETAEWIRALFNGYIIGDLNTKIEINPQLTYMKERVAETFGALPIKSTYFRSSVDD